MPRGLLAYEDSPATLAYGISSRPDLGQGGQGAVTLPGMSAFLGDSWTGKLMGSCQNRL